MRAERRCEEPAHATPHTAVAPATTALAIKNLRLRHFMIPGA
jgi:hypothetical protein